MFFAFQWGRNLMQEDDVLLEFLHLFRTKNKCSREKKITYFTLK